MVPNAPTSYRPQASLTGLRQILGERPTYPFHLITIPRGGIEDLADAGDDDDDVGTSLFQNITRRRATITSDVHYWALLPDEQRLRLDAVMTHPSAPRRRFLLAAYTAYEKPRDCLVQVLILRDWVTRTQYGGGGGCFNESCLELRYGMQVVTVTDSDAHETSLAVCFGDLTGDHTSAVKVLLPDRMLLYEPFAGGGDGGPLNSRSIPGNTAFWTSLDGIANVQELVVDSSNGGSGSTCGGSDGGGHDGGPRPWPRVRSLSLRAVAAKFLAASRLRDVFAAHPPRFLNCHAAFIKTKRPARCKPGMIVPHANTVVAFGATEAHTRLYHAFLFTLALPAPASDTTTTAHHHPRISIVKAKAFSSQDTFSWEGMEHTSPRRLLERAVVQLGIRASCVAEHGHNCEVDCDGGGDAIEVLKRYIFAESDSLSEIALPENGVVLKSWGWREHDSSDEDSLEQRRLNEEGINGYD